MIQKMFAVRDSKANAFLQPFFSSANGSAIRALADAVNDGKSPIALHPEDYILYEVGTFDDNLGVIEPVSPIKLLAMAVDLAHQVIKPEFKVAESDVVEKEAVLGKK